MVWTYHNKRTKALTLLVDKIDTPYYSGTTAREAANVKQIINGKEYEIGSDADLRRANLRGANLGGANLEGANLEGADLGGANLRGANLTEAYLRGADLYGASLRGADLRGANLDGADLRWADLDGANLRGAYLEGADLGGANLRGANLTEAYLHWVKGLDAFKVCPEVGQFIAFKKVAGTIITLMIPADAKRVNAYGSRKCRAEFAYVLSVENGGCSLIAHGGFTYPRSGLVTPDSYDPDPRVECSHGIHFFITRQEAQEYN